MIIPLHPRKNKKKTTEPAAPDDALVQAPSALLMEASTGTVIYEKDSDTRRSPASITKIMTLILIFDALENGTLKMDDLVTTSAYAKSMGGSQVFLGGRRNPGRGDYDQVHCDRLWK